MFTRRAANYWIIALALLSLASCKQTTGPADDSLVLIFTGDVLLDRGMRKPLEEKVFKGLIEEMGVADEFSKADAVVINLECPMTDTITPLNKRYIFRGDTRWACQMREVGITHAAMANNHTNDQGFQGLRNTQRALLDHGITPLGIGSSQEERLTPVVIAKGNVKVALFNAVLFPLENWVSGPSCHELIACQVEAQTLAQAIAKYKQQNSKTKVIAVVHWGEEFHTHANLKQRHEAKMLITAGADVIIGHHPHVQQEVTQVLDRWVCYSLGNFLFDHQQAEARHAGLARVVIMADSLPQVEVKTFLSPDPISQ